MVFALLICIVYYYICEAFLQKGPDVTKKCDFVDLNRAGRDKSVKRISVLAQIFTKLWLIYELHYFNNYLCGAIG